MAPIPGALEEGEAYVIDCVFRSALAVADEVHASISLSGRLPRGSPALSPPEPITNTVK
jgi:hypothetical protein